MKCESCGYEVPEGKKFCKQCGAPFDAGARQPGQQTPPAAVPPGPPAAPPATAPLPPAPPAPTTAPLAAAKGAVGSRPAGRFSGSPAWKVLAIVLVALLAAGAVTGLVFGLVALFKGKPTARIEQVTLRRQDGKSLNLDKVPLGVDVVIEAKFVATYDEGGRGTIKLAAMGSDGEELISDTYEVKSGSTAQTRELSLNMTRGSGEPLKAHAELVVRDGGKRLTSSKDLAFTAVEGTVEEDGSSTSDTPGDDTPSSDTADVEAAKAEVQNALDALQTALGQATQLGVDVSDLVSRLPELIVRLAAADTMDDVNYVASELTKIAEEVTRRLPQ